MVLVMVRVLPFFLTVTLICSVTLFVSILGVRSYSDQRYSSMQISATRHSSRVSTGRTAGFGYSFTGSDVDRDASCTRVSGGGVGRRSGQRGLEDGHLGGGNAATTKAVSGGSGSAVAALPTDMAAGATVGSGSLRWGIATAATKAIALARGASTAPRRQRSKTLRRVSHRCPRSALRYSRCRTHRRRRAWQRPNR